MLSIIALPRGVFFSHAFAVTQASCHMLWSQKARIPQLWNLERLNPTRKSLNCLCGLPFVSFQKKDWAHPTSNILISQVSPSSGSWHGGALLDIGGRGFHPEIFRQEVVIRLALQNGTIQDYPAVQLPWMLLEYAHLHKDPKKYAPVL